jgi:hypothetical protein
LLKSLAGCHSKFEISEKVWHVVIQNLKFLKKFGTLSFKNFLCKKVWQLKLVKYFQDRSQLQQLNFHHYSAQALVLLEQQ